MRRFAALVMFFSLLVMTVKAAPSGAAPVSAALPGVGRTVVTQGFAVTLVSVTRAPQAGTADYVAKKGNIFLFATVKILRKGSHESYTATPLDFEIVTSKSVAIDSDQFGVGSELSSKGIHNVAVTFVVGFEVPASDKGLQFLWQPSLASNPDVQATWLIGNAGKTVKSFS